MVPPVPLPPVPSSSPTNHFPPSVPHLLRPASPPSLPPPPSTTSSFFRHTLFRIIAHVHVFGSNTRVFHFTWTLIVHLCAHRPRGVESATDGGSEDESTEMKERKERHAAGAIADVARQGEKESKEEKQRRGGSEKEKAG